MRTSVKLCTLLLGACILATSPSFALDDNTKREIEKKIVKNKSYNNNRVKYTHTYSEETEIEKDQKEYENYDEFMYALVKRNNTQNTTPKAINSDTTLVAFDVVAERNKEYQKLLEAKKAEKEAKEAEKEAEDNKIFNARGYCTVNNKIEVTKMSEFGYLDCDLDGLGKVKVAAMFIPDFYSEALIAKPLYIDTPELKNRETKGVFLNATKTSINIASVVNDHKLKKILSQLSLTTANIATTQAQAYLKKVEESKVSQTTVETPSENQSSTVVATNTERPDKQDYIIAGSIQLVSEIVKILGDAYIDKFKFTFYTKENSVLYVDALIGKKLQSLRGVDFNDQNSFVHIPAKEKSTTSNNNFNYADSVKDIKFK